MRKLNLLERFRVTADEGSMHAAARRLGLTQPALTKSIRALEEEYNLSLFDRHSKGVSLSSFGERLYAHAKVIEREVQLADAELTHLQSGKSGLVNIGGGAVWATVLLPPIIMKLQKKFPEVHVNLTTGPNQSLVQHLLDGDIDLMVGGFREEAEDLPEFLTKRALCTFKSKIIARNDHPLHQNGTVNPAALRDYPWIVYKGDLGKFESGREQIVEVAGGLPKTLLYCESILATMNLVQDGDYLAFRSTALEMALPGFDVSPLPVGRAPAAYETGVIYRSSLRSIAPFAFLLKEVNALVADENFQRKLLE